MLEYKAPQQEVEEGPESKLGVMGQQELGNGVQREDLES